MAESLIAPHSEFGLIWRGKLDLPEVYKEFILIFHWFHSLDLHEDIYSFKIQTQKTSRLDSWSYKDTYILSSFNIF